MSRFRTVAFVILVALGFRAAYLANHNPAAEKTLAFVHAIVTQIPDAKRHFVRYYGGYSYWMRAKAACSVPKEESVPRRSVRQDRGMRP